MSVKKMSAKSSTPRKSRAKMPSMVSMSNEPMVHAPKVCRSCSALPAGSVELVSLLLVLVFSLSAVLLTSGYALQKQATHIQTLEAAV